jgi:hypothetical protein
MTPARVTAPWLGVVLQLEMLRLGAIWATVRREPVLWLGAALGFATLAVAANKAVEGSVALGGARPLLAVAAGAWLVNSLWPGPFSRARQGLLAGPFQPWLQPPARIAVWSALRAGIPALAGVVLTSLVLAIVSPSLAPAWAGLSLLGALAGGGLRLAADLQPGPPPRAAALPAAPIIAPRTPPSLARPSLYLARLRLARPLGGWPAWLVAAALLALAAAAGGLAARNNDDPQIGFVVLSIGAALAGLILCDPDLELARLMGHAPVSLPRLYGLAFGWLLPLICALTLAAGLAAGLPSHMAAAGAGVVLAGLALWSGLLLLHGVSMRPQAARLAATVDAMVMLALLLTFAPLLAAWIALRGAMLVAMARRRRWRDG